MLEPVRLDRPRPVDTRATDFARWEATHIRVHDLDQALRFRRDLLSLRATCGPDDEVSLGVEDAMRAGARRPTLRGSEGPYHVAPQIPSAKDFAEMYARVIQSRCRSTSD